MYLNKDLSFLRNQLLQQICFGLYQLQFHFTNTLSITVGSRIVFINKNQERFVWCGEFGRATICFNSILEEIIIDAEFSQNQELKLTFSNCEIPFGLSPFGNNQSTGRSKG